MHVKGLIMLDRKQITAICTSVIFSSIYRNIPEEQDDEFIKKAAKKIIKESEK